MTKVEIVDPWKLQRNHIWQKVKIVNTSKLLSKFPQARFARVLKLQEKPLAARYF